MGKSDDVFMQVRSLYFESQTKMGAWMWNNHVQWTADRARELAKKYGADPDKTYCAALLHDLGDSRFERDQEQFVPWSEAKGRAILLKAGFSSSDAEEIIEIIIRPHSCRAGNLPTTLEGKILSTADALFHLQTGFFPMLCFMHRPEDAKTYDVWQTWFNEKVEREFTIKLFFEEEKTAAKEDYEALTRVFKNTSLSDA